MEECSFMKQVQIETFAKVSNISRLTYSPNGSRCVFCLTTPNIETDGYDNVLWICENGSFRQLTYGGNEKQFLFLDDNTVLFSSAKEKDRPNYSSWQTICLKSGVIRDAFRFPVPVEDLILLADGDLLLRGNTWPGFEDLYLGEENEVKRFTQFMQDEADYEVLTAYPWWHNGGTFTKGMYHSLFRFHVKENRLERLSGLNEDITNIRLSDDQKYVFYFRARADFRDTPNLNLCRLDLATKEEKLLVSEEMLLVNHVPCGDKVIVAFSDRTHGRSSDPDLYLIDPEDPKPVLFASLDRSITDLKCRDGKAWLIINDYDSSYVCTAEDGKIVKKTSKAGLVTSFDVYGDDFLISAQYDTRPDEIYNSQQVRLSHFHDEICEEYDVSVPEAIEFVNDGVGLRGYIMKPCDFDENRKYPTLLYIHGGPKGLYSPVYMHEQQYWAQKGYIVLFTNIRGSDGRGSEFADIRGKYGTVDYDDLMKFMDVSIERYPQIDTEKLMVTGGSYGGFMTNWIISHTDRFRTAISQCCVSNWITLDLVSDIGLEFCEDQCASDPWDAGNEMWNQSPLKYAGNIKTPTMFIHGFEDYRTPIDQGYQMYTALKRFGVETKMVLFRGDHHSLPRVGKPSHRIRRIKEMADWFADHLG